MAYVRRDVTDGVTVMDKDLYDNLQDGIDESKEDLESVKESVLEVEDQVTELENQIDTATEIAKGRNRAKVFSTTEKMQEWLSNPENKNLCNVGDNLYIVDIGVPDWWVAEVLNEVDKTGYYYKIAQLETQKVDLTTIEEEIEYLTDILGEDENGMTVHEKLDYIMDNGTSSSGSGYLLIKGLSVTAYWTSDGANTSNKASAVSSCSVEVAGRTKVTVGSLSGSVTMKAYDVLGTSLGSFSVTGGTPIELPENTDYISFVLSTGYANKNGSSSVSLNNILIE